MKVGVLLPLHLSDLLGQLNAVEWHPETWGWFVKSIAVSIQATGNVFLGEVRHHAGDNQECEEAQASHVEKPHGWCRGEGGKGKRKGEICHVPDQPQLFLPSLSVQASDLWVKKTLGDSSHSQGLPTPIWGVVNKNCPAEPTGLQNWKRKCCFKLLNFGVVCYTGIESWNRHHTQFFIHVA